MDFASQLSSLKRKVSAVTEPKDRSDLRIRTHETASVVNSIHTTSSNHYSYTVSSDNKSRYYHAEEQERFKTFIHTIQDMAPTWIHKCKTPLLLDNPNSDDLKNSKHHIALLFITIDDIPFECIWKRWLEDFQKSPVYPFLQVSILVHAKYPERVQSPWVRDRLLLLRKPITTTSTNAITPETISSSPRYHSYRPEWGSVEITRAMMDLLQEGLLIGSSDGEEFHLKHDTRYSTLRYLATVESQQQQKVEEFKSIHVPVVDRFIFLSESCLPITTLAQIYHSLFPKESQQEVESLNKIPTTTTTTTATNIHLGQSWIHARNTPNNGFSRQNQWDVLSPFIPKENIWKADQWMVLTRFHALCICIIQDEEDMSTMKQQQQEMTIPSSHSTNRNEGDGKKKIELWKTFRKVRASDEIYFPTLLSLLGLIQSSTQNSIVLGDMNTQTMKDNLLLDYPYLGDDIVNRRVTYCDWSNNAKNPETFLMDNIHELKRIISEAKKEGCLFARKFKYLEDHDASFTVRGNITETWMELIYGKKVEE